MAKLLALSGTTNKNSAPIYWKGGYGTATYVGDYDGTAALHYQPSSASESTGAAASYVTHGAEVDSSDRINHFHCAEGWIYIAVTGGSTGTYAVHITRDEYTAPSDGLSLLTGASAVA